MSTMQDRHFHLETELEAVERDMHAGGEPGFGGLRKVVAYVGEISRLRLYARGDFERLAWPTLKCVGCGLSRSASIIRTFTPAIRSTIASGTALQSLR